MKISCMLRICNLQIILVEDSSHDFWDVDSSKNVEGMPNFLGNSKEIDSENEGKKKMHFIQKKGIF